MGKRTWGFVTLAAGGTPQPVFGTTLTTAVAANPLLGGNYFDLTVGAFSLIPGCGFKNGDNIILDPAGANPERLLIQKVVSGTVLRVRSQDGFGLQFSHAATVFVQLAIPCVSFFVQCNEGNAGKIYIGNSATMVKATGVGVIAILEFTSSGIQPFNFADPMYGSTPGLTSDSYWFDGTTSDKILPSLTLL
jgi:hypothetical protein